jgi:hypothetical protein
VRAFAQINVSALPFTAMELKNIILGIDLKKYIFTDKLQRFEISRHQLHNLICQEQMKVHHKK